MRYLIYFFIFVLSFLVLLLSPNNTLQSIATSFFAGISLFFVDTTIHHWKYINLIFWSIRYRNGTIRLSMAHLIRIKVNHQYLLVKSKHRQTYQPPGGVYKQFPDANAFFKEIGVLDDNFIPYDTSSADDLRIQIQGKYLLRFMLWFDEAKCREISPWREFYEELIATNILSKTHFPYIHYQLIKRCQSPIHFSKTSDAYELRVADIFELLPDDNQRKELTDLKNQPDGQYMWADEQTIKRQGVIPQQSVVKTIGDHAIWIV
ncbi:conserved hypothetical protein, secreted [Candidatus Magnetomorum sp. HK-1]|nr:conserved hypothetical protein, secreted [Candidatus Magnetomorum sp. HK-1]